MCRGSTRVQRSILTPTPRECRSNRIGRPAPNRDVRGSSPLALVNAGRSRGADAGSYPAGTGSSPGSASNHSSRRQADALSSTSTPGRMPRRDIHMPFTDPQAAKAYYRARDARPEVRARMARRRDAAYRLVRALKSRPCADCGLRFPPEAMDLDHVRGTKVFGFATAMGRSLISLMIEAAKCDIVCANCHRVRTFARAA